MKSNLDNNFTQISLFNNAYTGLLFFYANFPMNHCSIISCTHYTVTVLLYIINAVDMYPVSSMLPTSRKSNWPI